MQKLHTSHLTSSFSLIWHLKPLSLVQARLISHIQIISGLNTWRTGTIYSQTSALPEPASAQITFEAVFLWCIAQKQPFGHKTDWCFSVVFFSLPFPFFAGWGGNTLALFVCRWWICPLLVTAVTLQNVKSDTCLQGHALIIYCSQSHCFPFQKQNSSNCILAQNKTIFYINNQQHQGIMFWVSPQTHTGVMRSPHRKCEDVNVRRASVNNTDYSGEYEQEENTPYKHEHLILNALTESASMPTNSHFGRKSLLQPVCPTNQHDCNAAGCLSS